MTTGPERLGYELSGVRVVRAVWTAGAFALAAAVLPELEDVGSVALWVGGLSGAGFVVAALAGAAWAFDAEDLEQARARAARAWSAASFCGLLFSAALLTQLGLAPGGWRGWAYLLAPLTAWLAWVDFPWVYLDGVRERLKGKPPGPERYDAAPAPRPAAERASPRELPPGVEALLVGAGAFKVDRARMVQKLAQFQTGDPEGFLLPWLRLAVASGATRLELSLRETGLELQFDGKPLGARFCDDPFEALVGEEDASGEADRHRHLAWGLLNLLPLAPRAVVGRSGAARLLVEPKGVEKKHWVDPEPRLGTALRVVFDGWDADLKAARCLARAREAWGLADAELTVDGKAVPAWEPRPGVGTRFSVGGARGVFYREDKSERFYSPRLYWLGAFVCEDSPVTLPMGWACRLTFEGLATSASLLTVQWNEAFKALGGPVRGEFDRLADAGKLGSGVLLAPAYSKAGLASALGGGVLAFAAFIAAESARPDLAWAAAGAYVATTAAVVALLGRWAWGRLLGRRNPFRD
ncbi:hypothetical protein EPO15_16080 [bacterium]|nr:MAG: hypothetical protein EPO15_16080 [bacterium]